MTGTRLLPAEVDVVVVGAGGAGMTAALAAAQPRPRHRPASRRAPTSAARPPAAAAASGSRATTRCATPGRSTPTTSSAAKLYLDSIVGDVVPKVRRDTYLDRGPEVMDFLRDQTPVRFALGAAVRRLPPRAARRPRRAAAASSRSRWTPRFLGDELDRLHPAVHQGAGQPDRHPGRLPQDQPRPAHRSAARSRWRKVLLRRLVSIAAAAGRCTRWATRSRSGCARG